MTNQLQLRAQQMIDGYYLGSADGYKIEPWDFKSGGSSIGSGFVMGLRMAKENTKHKKLSIIQVKKGLQIKILDNNGNTIRVVNYYGVYPVSYSFGNLDYSSPDVVVGSMKFYFYGYEITNEENALAGNIGKDVLNSIPSLNRGSSCKSMGDY